MGVNCVALSNDLLSQFAKITNDKTNVKKETTTYGTAKVVGGVTYVQLDGSDLLTPYSSTADVKDGDRVQVAIKNHNATITGNLSSPSARTDDVKEIDNKVTSHGNTITSINNSVKEIDNNITSINNNITEIGNTIDSQGNQITQINNVVTSQGNTINSLNNTVDSQGNTITEIGDTVNSQGNTIKSISNTIDAQGNQITAINNTIESQGNTITEIGDTVNSQGNTINSIGNTVDAQGNQIAAINNDIEIYNSSFQIANGIVTGIKGVDTEWIKTEDLEADHAVIASLDNKYANIDFTNIGKAAMEYFYANSGLIKDVVVGDQKITGHLIGVTISGDLIEGNTIVAEKLVIKGDDGLYYKLNTDGIKTEAEQTDYNSINGTIIKAKSITATKIAVEDLVAFGATIGGFVITDNSIHSGVKESVDNATKGIYLDNQGQIAFGDGTNFVKYYKDAEGNYRLAISAESIDVGTTSKTDIGTAIDNIQEKANSAIISSIEQFYKSDSPTSLSGGSWSIVEPVWEDGKYLWRRTKNTYGDGHSDYTPSENGVCITGNTGAKGDRGIPGTNATNGKTSYLHIAYANSADGKTGFDVSTSTNKLYIGQYTDFTSEDSTDPTKYSWTKIKGDDGKNGTSSYTHIRYSVNSNGNPMVTTPTDSTLYIGIYTGTSSTAPASYTSYTWSRYTGKDGTNGKNGKDGNGINSISYFYAVTSTQNAPSASNITSTSIPVLSPTNKYLWQKEVIDFTDSSVADKTSVILLAVYGDKGTSIIITNSSITYQASTSGTEAPTGTWSTSIPSISEGSYLWTKTVVTYSDGNSTTAYSVAYKGKNGATGPQGPKGDAGDAGADAISITITASAGTVFKNNSGSTTLTAHVYKGGIEQTVETSGKCGSLGYIKWYKGTSTTVAATAKTLTVTASEVTNSMAITCQLES